MRISYLRAVFAIITVILPAIIVTTLFDVFGNKFLGNDPSSLLLPLQKSDFFEPNTVEFLTARWAGGMNYLAVSVFYWFVCAFFFVMASWVLWTRSSDYFVWSVRKKTISLALIVVVVLCAGYSFGSNGEPKPYISSQSCGLAQLEEKGFFDSLIFSRMDDVRAHVVRSLSCNIQKFGGNPDDGFERAWRTLSTNSVVSYATALYLLIALASVSLPSGVFSLVTRGAQMRWLLISLSAVISIGTVQLHCFSIGR